jgi:hypothetical protein
MKKFYGSFGTTFKGHLGYWVQELLEPKGQMLIQRDNHKCREVTHI